MFIERVNTSVLKLMRFITQLYLIYPNKTWDYFGKSLKKGILKYGALAFKRNIACKGPFAYHAIKNLAIFTPPYYPLS